MKQKIIIGTIIAVAVIGTIIALIFILKPAKGVNTNSEIESFEYNFGSGEGTWDEYKITIRDGKYHMTGTGYNSSTININRDITESDMEKLNNIIKDNNIDSWDGFDESDDNVLDGYGFKLIVKYKNGDDIEAEGYMQYPDNYKKGDNALEEFLESFSY